MSAEPSRQVADRGTTGVVDERLEVVFDRSHSFDAKLADPALPKLLEDLCAEPEHLFAARAPHEHRSSGIIVAGSPSDVAQLLEPGRGLGGCLLADPQAPAQLTDGGTVWPDGLEREAVYRSRFGVPVLLELDVQLVNDPSERSAKKQRQFEAGAIHTLDFRGGWTGSTTRFTI